MTYSVSRATCDTPLYRHMLSKLDGSLPANPVNDRRVANAVTLKNTFLSTVKSAIIQKYLIMEPPEK